MQYSEYLSREKKLIKKGILQERIFKRKIELDKKVISYKFQNIDREGILEPIFKTNRLDLLRIYIDGEIGDEKQEEITTEEYFEIVGLMKKEYGQPLESRKDPQSEHRSTKWENDDYYLEVYFTPSSVDSKNRISIIFSPNGDFAEAMEEYNLEKKKEWEKLDY